MIRTKNNTLPLTIRLN